MTEIPLFNGEAASSVRGVMLFPDDPDKARAWSSRHIANGPIETYLETGHRLSQAATVALMKSAGADLLEAESLQSETEGKAVGKIVGHLIREIDGGKRASWNKSIKYAGPQVSRASVANYRSHMRRVQHLWGAYYLADCQWFSHGEGTERVYQFLYESELILSKLEKWSAASKQLQYNRGYLDADHYRMPSWALRLKKPV
jgi:hypothetical protein